MNKTYRLLPALMFLGGMLALTGCSGSHSEDDATASKKAVDSQQATSGAPSLGNPKPADASGSK